MKYRKNTALDIKKCGVAKLRMIMGPSPLSSLWCSLLFSVVSLCELKLSDLCFFCRFLEHFSEVFYHYNIVLEMHNTMHSSSLDHLTMG
jgi:hypothetical protein